MILTPTSGIAAEKNVCLLGVIVFYGGIRKESTSDRNFTTAYHPSDFQTTDQLGLFFTWVYEKSIRLNMKKLTEECSREGVVVVMIIAIRRKKRRSEIVIHIRFVLVIIFLVVNSSDHCS